MNDTDPSILRFLLASREEVCNAFALTHYSYMDHLSCFFLGS